MTSTADQLATYFEAYGALSAQEREPVWLRQLREEAWGGFSEKGFPTTHDEDWRFTNLATLAKIPFRRAGKSDVAPIAQQIKAFRLSDAASQLVFVNGIFAPELSDIKNLPTGLEVNSLARAIAAKAAPEGIEQHLGRYADAHRDVFVALNTALWEDGAYIRVSRNTVIEKPIHLLFVTAGSGESIMTHPRTLVIAEENSQAAVIEDYVSIGEEAAFSNAVTEYVAAEGANVSHFMAERENLASYNVSTLRIELARTANVSSHSLLLGGRLVRNNVHPVLNGEGAECLINGLFVGKGNQHLDNYMMVEHAQAHCDSRQFYNGILAGSARGVFHGRIVVHKDAQKTDAKQTNRNLLLSDSARIDTKPQLEIYADDVKCTHGATIGQIAEESLFYLRARGIDETTARSMLLHAFASECLDRVDEPAVRAFADSLIESTLSELSAAAPVVASTASNEDEGQNWEELG